MHMENTVAREEIKEVLDSLENSISTTKAPDKTVTYDTPCFDYSEWEDVKLPKRPVLELREDPFTY